MYINWAGSKDSFSFFDISRLKATFWGFFLVDHGAEMKIRAFDDDIPEKTNISIDFKFVTHLTKLHVPTHLRVTYTFAHLLLT